MSFWTPAVRSRIYLSAGSPKNDRSFSGISLSLASAVVANFASSLSLFTDARPRLSCFTFFQTHSSGFRSGE